MGGPEWALLVLHSMLWGSAYFFIAVASRELPVFTITCLRMIPGIALLAVLCRWADYRFPARLADWARFAVLALLNNYVPFCLIVWAQHQVTGGMAAVFCATTPLFGIFLAHVLTHDEKVSPLKLAGVLIGIAGVAILALPDLLGGQQSSLLAKLALLLASLLYALGGIFSRRLTGYPPMMMSCAHMIATFTLALPPMLLFDRPWTLPMPSLAAIAAVCSTGILASALASIIYFTLIRRAGATNALLVTLLLPLTPMALGYLVLGETMTAHELTGAGVIALALLVIDGRVARRLTRSGSSPRPS